MRPRPKLAAETRANKLRDDAHVFFRQTEHLREHAPHVEDPLRLLVDRQLVAIPDRGCRLQLDGIVRLGRRDISLVELDRRARESASASPRSLCRRFVRAEVCQLSSGSSSALRSVIDVRFLLRVGDANRVRGSFGALESVRHRERDVLAVVANDIVLERRTPFDHRCLRSPVPASNGKSFRCSRDEKSRARRASSLPRRCRALRSCRWRSSPRPERHTHSGKVEVGGVLRRSAHLQRAIDARRLCDRSATSVGFLDRACRSR